MIEPLKDLNPCLNRIPDSIKSIHIMGVCGTAMAAVAGMLKQLGYQVSGSDSHVYPPMSTFLDNIGVNIYSDYHAENLAHAPDLVLVGNVITKKNPESQALAESGIPYISMPQALAHFFINSRKSLVIAGTHGKTTTSSMLASALYTAGADPTFMIGGILKEFDSNFRIGSGPYFVAEGDEYDTAFFDKVSKFLHYQPQVAVITSLEFDHADIFEDLEAIKRSFREFVRLLPPDGLIIANYDDPNVMDVVMNAPCPVQSYGVSQGCDWRVGRPSYASGLNRFPLYLQNTEFSEVAIKNPGLHNAMNSVAVIAIMHHLGFEKNIILQTLEQFSGVKRRQEVRGVVNDITVIDDFAHHPTAVRETLAGLKQAYGDNRLIAVFEPRTNTSRRSFFQKEYALAFDHADLALIREPAPAALIDEKDLFSSEKLAKDLARRGIDALSFAETDEILAHILTVAAPGDNIAILSNGGFDNIHTRLLENLRKKYGETAC